jgi:hypothetical protein
MTLSAFDDKARPPEDQELSKVLGRSLRVWSRLKELLAEDHPPMTESWGYAGKDYGWSLRLERKKRRVIYLTPQERHFLVGIVLGEKAVKAARQARLPPEVLERVEAAPRYAEGRGLRLEVRFKKDIDAIRELARAKMAN